MIKVNNNSKLIVILILFNIFSINLYSQNQVNVNTEKFKIIARDTFWIKKSIWKENQKSYKLLYNNANSSKYINPILKINNNSDAEKFDFIIVPFYKIPKYKIDSIYTVDFMNIIEFDSTLYWVLVKYENEIVGKMDICYKNNKWIGALEVYNGNGPMNIAYSKIKKMTSIDTLFTIKYLGGIWFIKNNQIKVYSFYSKNNSNYLKYIKKHFSLQSIKESYNWQSTK